MPTPRNPRHSTDTGSDTTPNLFLTRPAWHADALCLEPSAVATVGTNMVDAERYKAASAAALQLCGRCAVREECLAQALADPTLVGIWGGTDTAARKAIRANRTRAAVDSTTERGGCG